MIILIISGTVAPHVTSDVGNSHVNTDNKITSSAGDAHFSGHPRHLKDTHRQQTPSKHWA